MSIKGVQDIFGLVQKPSQYLGTEINSIHKVPGDTRLNIALAFPDLYEIGTSHFGIQILYHLLNKHQDITAERVFAPAGDMEVLLRQNGLKLFSLESRRELSQFDIIGFSLLYELNYTNVLNMLDLAGIPLRWSQRDNSQPLVIAGGPCVCNPEPMADFFDAMVFGDGERVVPEMAERWFRWKGAGSGDKESLLRQWSELEGVYIPKFFKPTYDEKGFQHLKPVIGNYETIHRTIVADLDQAYFPENPVIPFGRPVHDRLRLEISRGCSRGCRFCQAGMIYRPVRERSPETLLNLVRQALDQTGYDDLSLLSLSTGDYTCLAPLMENLMQLCQGDRVAVSLPSLRAGSLTPRLMKMIRSIRKTGFTIAPEAGTQRLRDVINKNISYEDVAGTVQHAFDLGWKVIKLYFMIGLPTETQDDLEGIVEMVRRLKKIKSTQGRKGQINVSVTTFVPKAHTAFQWASQISLDASREKLAYLRSRLKMPGVRLKWQHPDMSVLEGILARGDRRLSDVIENAWKSGCTFDGWNDRFDFEPWQKALVQCGQGDGFLNPAPRQLDDPLPWDHLESGVDKGFLMEQWDAASRGGRLGDCRHGDCHACGVCDFQQLQPRVFENCPAALEDHSHQATAEEDQFIWMELTYCKLDQARFFSHLELGNIFARAVRRANIPVQYSKGFHPMPRISFDDPLPLGIASQGEQMRIQVSSKFTCQDVMEGINVHLPQGIRILACKLSSAGRKTVSPKVHRFKIDSGDLTLDQEALSRFEASGHWPYSKSRPKRPDQTIDLKTVIKTADLKGCSQIYLEIKAGSGPTVRPTDFLSGVFGLTPEDLPKVMVTKLKG